jgi:hypothetical protein
MPPADDWCPFRAKRAKDRCDPTGLAAQIKRLRAQYAPSSSKAEAQVQRFGRTPPDASTFLGVSPFRASCLPLLASVAFRFRCGRLSLVARKGRREPSTRCIHPLNYPPNKSLGVYGSWELLIPGTAKPICPITAYDLMGVRRVKKLAACCLALVKRTRSSGPASHRISMIGAPVQPIPIGNRWQDSGASNLQPQRIGLFVVVSVRD